MACVCRNLSKVILSSPLMPFVRQPVRTTVILRRMYPPKLYEPSQTGPFRPELEEDEYVYMLEENKNLAPAGNMDVMLATDVEGLGFKGDIVNVEKKLARNYLFPLCVAEYVTPENLIKYESTRKDNDGRIRQSLTGHQTLKKLTSMTLPIGMSSTVPWTLNKNHVKVAFRVCGVNLTEDCIELPEEPITSPTETTVKVKVNQLESVSVRAIVYHYSKSVAPVLPPVWSMTNAPKFDVVEAVLKAANLKHNKSIKQEVSN